MSNPINILLHNHAFILLENFNYQFFPAIDAGVTMLNSRRPLLIGSVWWRAAGGAAMDLVETDFPLNVIHL